MTTTVETDPADSFLDALAGVPADSTPLRSRDDRWATLYNSPELFGFRAVAEVDWIDEPYEYNFAALYEHTTSGAFYRVRSEPGAALGRVA